MDRTHRPFSFDTRAIHLELPNRSDTIVAVLLPVPALQKVFLVSVLIMVLMVEILNSAIEAVVDRIGLERHPLSKRAKDLGSAAVTLSLVIAALAWVSVLSNHFYLNRV